MPIAAIFRKLSKGYTVVHDKPFPSTRRLPATAAGRLVVGNGLQRKGDWKSFAPSSFSAAAAYNATTGRLLQ